MLANSASGIALCADASGEGDAGGVLPEYDDAIHAIRAALATPSAQDSSMAGSLEKAGMVTMTRLWDRSVWNMHRSQGRWRTFILKWPRSSVLGDSSWPRSSIPA